MFRKLLLLEKLHKRSTSTCAQCQKTPITPRWEWTSNCGHKDWPGYSAVVFDPQAHVTPFWAWIEIGCKVHRHCQHNTRIQTVDLRCSQPQICWSIRCALWKHRTTHWGDTRATCVVTDRTYQVLLITKCCKRLISRILNLIIFNTLVRWLHYLNAHWRKHTSDLIDRGRKWTWKPFWSFRWFSCCCLCWTEAMDSQVTIIRTCISALYS